MNEYTGFEQRNSIPENRFGIVGVDHVGMACRDPEAAGEFVEDILGGVMLIKAGYSPEDIQLGRPKHIFYLVGATVVELAVQQDESAYATPDRTSDQPHYAFAMSKESLLKFADHLRAHNVPFNGPRSHRGMSACSIYFRDPDGNNLEVSTWEALTEEQAPMMNKANGFVVWAELAHNWKRAA